MNIKEHLLVCLAEEAAEVAQDCAKSLRFGLDDVNIINPDGPTNRERLIVELNQLVACVEMLVTIGALPHNWQRRSVQVEKCKKVDEFMAYARERGTLQEQACRVCGCTDLNACAEGCHWVEVDLCSACVPKARTNGHAKRCARKGALR